MYNPDNPNRKLKVGGTNLEVSPMQRVVQRDALQSPDSTLKYYLRHSKQTYEAYGLKKVDGRLVVADLEKINKFDELTKQILREVLTGR